MTISTAITLYGPTCTIDNTNRLCILYKLVAIRIVIGASSLSLLAEELFYEILAQTVTQKKFNSWDFKDVFQYLYKRRHCKGDGKNSNINKIL